MLSPIFWHQFFSVDPLYTGLLVDLFKRTVGRGAFFDFALQIPNGVSRYTALYDFSLFQATWTRSDRTHALTLSRTALYRVCAQ